MSDLLQSPFTLGVCVATLVAWVVMLCAIFWPGKGHTCEDERDVRF
jgi:hypothetical protein